MWKYDDVTAIRYMKNFYGILGSPFMFVLQLAILMQRTPVGPKLGVPDGQCELHLASYNSSQFG